MQVTFVGFAYVTDPEINQPAVKTFGSPYRMVRRSCGWPGCWAAGLTGGSPLITVSRATWGLEIFGDPENESGGRTLGACCCYTSAEPACIAHFPLSAARMTFLPKPPRPSAIGCAKRRRCASAGTRSQSRQGCAAINLRCSLSRRRRGAPQGKNALVGVLAGAGFPHAARGHAQKCAYSLEKRSQ